MPIYEYQCGNCGVFEVTQRITEPALKRCPTCKRKVDRLLSRSSFVLKGSGWYATDYASGARSKTDGEAGAGETAKANGATDSSSADSAKTASDSATKSADSSSSAKTSASQPAAKLPGKSSGKDSASKSAASKSAD